ncbi:hypothetical protein [Fluviicoccus keumensis]|uniref:hypothetical protein n=1 Tax=Fluviicoccus keumensis TaxID=1435465 RepID=UPI00102C4C3B|nr:hypothetical protein [Fluviicoccus keumensis]
MPVAKPSSAVVPLNPPALPDIPGLDRFEGRILHVAAWDPQYPLEGRQAAIVGDLFACVRLIPAIAPRLRHLTVFQQAPVWVAPQPGPVLAAMLRRMKATPGSLLGVWQDRVMEELCKWHLRSQIPAAALRQRLMPDERCRERRYVFANDYYPAFNRRNVTLITEPLARVRPGSLETALQRRHPVDILIIAPGYAAPAAMSAAAVITPHQTGFQTAST